MQYGYYSPNFSMLGEMRDKKLTTDYDKVDPSYNVKPQDQWQSGAAQGMQAGMASGSLGGTAMGAGLGAALSPGAFAAGAAAGPVGLGVAGAGLLLTQLEQKQKAKAMQEQAVAEEANQRKQQTMAALNNLMNQRVSVA